MLRGPRAREYWLADRCVGAETILMGIAQAFILSTMASSLISLSSVAWISLLRPWNFFLSASFELAKSIFFLTPKPSGTQKTKSSSFLVMALALCSYSTSTIAAHGSSFGMALRKSSRVLSAFPILFSLLSSTSHFFPPTIVNKTHFKASGFFDLIWLNFSIALSVQVTPELEPDILQSSNDFPRPGLPQLLPPAGCDKM